MASTIPIRREATGVPARRAQAAASPAEKTDTVGQRREADDLGLGPLVEALRALEGDGAGEDPAIDLGERHVHRQIAGREAACALAPGGLAAARKHQLQDRAARLVERRRAALTGAGDGKAGRVQDHRGRRLGEQLAHQWRRNRVLQAGGEDRQRIETGAIERFDQGVDRREIARLNQGAVEHQGGRGSAGLPASLQIVEGRTADARPVQPGAEQRRGLVPWLLAAEQTRRIGQKLRGVIEAAMDAVLPEAMAGLGRQSGPGGKLGVRLIVARQRGEQASACATRRRHLLEAIGPVAAAAQEAEHDQLRPGDHPLDIEVDRERMAELEQIGEAEAGRALRPAGFGRREAGELGIGRRQDDDVAWRLAEIDRLACGLGRDRLRAEEVHGSG